MKPLERKSQPIFSRAQYAMLWREAMRNFDSYQDRDEFMQECRLVAWETGLKKGVPAEVLAKKYIFDVKYVAKDARRNILLSIKDFCYADRRLKRIGAICRDGEQKVLSKRWMPFAEAMDHFKPANARDAVRTGLNRLVDEKGRFYFFDDYDLKELMSWSHDTLKHSRCKQTALNLWEFDGKLWKSLLSIEKKFGFSRFKSRACTRKIVLRWSKV